MIRYAIDVAATHRHTFAVELHIDHPTAEQRLSLPVWIPGSYLVREFARHLSMLSAEQGGAPVPVRQLDKATWSVGCAAGAPLAVRYQVYSFDTSVRAAFLDASRGFFNGTSVCLRVEGREGEAHALAVVGLPEGWELATSLDARSGAASHEFVATDYDALVDHPIELGRFWRQRFEVAGVAHEFVVAGALPDFDGERLVADTRRICEAEIRFWHGEGRAPFDRYLFLLNAIEDGRGGLEHRSSTALVAARRDLPRQSAFDAGKNAGSRADPPSDGYVGVLGVIAHEYFHAWNVKRLRPRDFASLDYGRENYTELLWFFEGFTSYYDDVMLLRSGLIDAPRYLKLLATTMTGVQASPGRALQSVAAASFDAWVKYYRADENTPNATISYYAKGSLVALALDLTLRSEGRGSLDDVMRLLWRTSADGLIDEKDIATALETVGGRSFEREIAAWVHGTDELPLAELLARFAVDVELQAATLAQRLGIRVSESALTGVKISHVLRDGAGERAGLAPGDELIAAGGWRIRRLDDALRALLPGRETPLLVSRDQRLLTLALDGALLAGAGAVQLKPGDKADAEARRRYEAWIAG
ncbi:MAG TPA: PDZ domain-containing protein [Caldimonas sp.]|nr:PDZ domain-containing protein [Caldimonas sp.]HEX4234236.1 PDZ domain-containing protein [Caldimonas sp.]